MFLGRLAYLDGKPEGDKSMPAKRWPSGGVQGGVPQDPRDMAKAGLLEAQSPAVKDRTRRNDAWNRCRVVPGLEPVRLVQSPRRRAPGRRANRPALRSIRSPGADCARLGRAAGLPRILLLPCPDDSLGERPLRQPSAELLGQCDDDALGAADVTEP